MLGAQHQLATKNDKKAKKSGLVYEKVNKRRLICG